MPTTEEEDNGEEDDDASAGGAFDFDEEDEEEEQHEQEGDDEPAAPPSNKRTHSESSRHTSYALTDVSPILEAELTHLKLAPPKAPEVTSRAHDASKRARGPGLGDRTGFKKVLKFQRS